MSDEVYGPDDWRQLTQAASPVVPGLMRTMCSAVKDDGEDCKMKALPGGVLCAYHGGNTVIAMDQNRRRLDMVRAQLFDTLVDAGSEAIDTYVAIMRDGKKDSDRLRAADRILELMGIRDQVVQVKVTQQAEATDLEDEIFKLLAHVTQERMGEIIETTEAKTA